MSPQRVELGAVTSQLDEERLRPTFPGQLCKVRNSGKLLCPSSDRISLLLIKGYGPKLPLIINESR